MYLTQGEKCEYMKTTVFDSMVGCMETKKKLMHGAVWLWCASEGYEEQENKESFLDAIFFKQEKTIGFIFEFDKTVDEMLSQIEKAKETAQYIYIVIDDDSKYRRLKKVLPEFCGIFCNSNAFGFGMVTQIMKMATFLSEISAKNNRLKHNNCPNLS